MTGFTSKRQMAMDKLVEIQEELGMYDDQKPEPSKKRPVESDYVSQVAYTRALEAYCDTLAQPAQEPVALFMKITDRDVGLSRTAQEPVAWRNAAIRLGEELSSVGPDGYYDMTAEQWFDWAMEQEPQGKNSLAQPEQGLDEAAIRADERDIIFNLVQKIAARFYKDDAEKAFEELTEAIRARGNT